MVSMILDPFVARAPALPLPQISTQRVQEVVGQINANRAQFAKEPIDATKPLLHVAVGKSVFFDTTSGYDGPPSDSPEWLAAWSEFMAKNQDKILPQGRVYPFVRRLLDINELSPDPKRQPLVQVDFVTQITRRARPRVYNSLIKHGLMQYSDKGLLTDTWIDCGTDPKANTEAIVDTLKHSGAHFYFASQKDIAEAALKVAGIGAAYMLPGTTIKPYDPANPATLIFDGDGVLWTDKAEKVFQDNYQAGLVQAKEKGLDQKATEEFAYQMAVVKFNEYMYENKNNPEMDGPGVDFFVRLSILNALWESEKDRTKSPFDIRLATSRGPVGEMQASNFLESQGIRDPRRSTFMSGRTKNPYLKGAVLYVEDSRSHLDGTQKMSPEERPQGLALIPYGVKNSGAKTLEVAPGASH